MNAETFFEEILTNKFREDVAIFFFAYKKGTVKEILAALSRIRKDLTEKKLVEILDYYVKIGLISKTGNIFRVNEGFLKDIQIDMGLLEGTA